MHCCGELNQLKLDTLGTETALAGWFKGLGKKKKKIKEKRPVEKVESSGKKTLTITRLKYRNFYRKRVKREKKWRKQKENRKEELYIQATIKKNEELKNLEVVWKELLGLLVKCMTGKRRESWKYEESI